MQVNLKLTLEQANVVNEALLALLKVNRFNVKAVAATPEEKLDAQREVMQVEQTLRALGLSVPEWDKEVTA